MVVYTETNLKCMLKHSRHKVFNKSTVLQGQAQGCIRGKPCPIRNKVRFLKRYECARALSSAILSSGIPTVFAPVVVASSGSKHIPDMTMRPSGWTQTHI